jgi:phage/plasmid-associated DNA primase
MMQEHFLGDEDAAEKIACEQEHFGGALFGMAPTYQKCLALPSGGGGGRSTFLETIEAAFPAGTVAHIDMRDLRNPERRTRLVGKLLNFSDEVPPDAFMQAEDFKKAVTGNVLTAEGKYHASFEFRSRALLVCPIQVSAAAELTAAFFDRFNLVRYNRNFRSERSRILDLAKQIISEELPGIVAWLVEGAARLRRQGHYTLPASHHSELLRWRVEADTVAGFLAEETVRATFNEPKNRKRGTVRPDDRHDWTAGSDLFPLYQIWCEANGHRKPVAAGKFGERLKALAPSKRTEKGTYYGVISRVRAEARERERASREHRDPRALPGFFERPSGIISVISGTSDDSGKPDGSGRSALSGTTEGKSDSSDDSDGLTGDHQNFLYARARGPEVSASTPSACQSEAKAARPKAESPDGPHPLSPSGSGRARKVAE